MPPPPGLQPASLPALNPTAHLQGVNLASAPTQPLLPTTTTTGVLNHLPPTVLRPPIFRPPIIFRPPPIILRPPPVIIHPPPVIPPTPVQTTFAPAWLYSALAWLGRSYVDASGSSQFFNTYLFGSDVDPYAQLGRSRLFVITLIRGTLVLQYGADIDALPQAPSIGTQFPYNDDGVLQLYNTLAASTIFPSFRYCYVPCTIGPDVLSGSSVSGLTPGYDPSSGLRAIVAGSAVSQVVPLDDYINTHNEQIYNASPSIVPLVSAFVYDVAYNNTLSTTSFVLPIFYTRDQVSTGKFYVNRFESAAVISDTNVHCGQTVAFTGGAGFDGSQATALTLVGSSSTTVGDNTLSTYDYGVAKVTTGFPGVPSSGVGSSSTAVDTGIVALNCTAASPFTAFSNQRIIGFYRKPGWSTCLGVPIYDYLNSNASFTTQAAATDLSDPTLLYDPSLPYLNGGSLPNVVRNYFQAQRPFSQDQLLGVLRGAIAAHDTSKGAGVGVTTAALSFRLTSAQTSPVVDQLTVPIVTTVTTTPPMIFRPPIFHPINEFPTLGETARINPQLVSSLAGRERLIINSGASSRGFIPPVPTTVQTGLSASVPREALDGTGIISVDVGTPFPRRPLGSGSTFQSLDHGTVINLMEREDVGPGSPPFDLATTTAGFNFAVGTYYVLALSGSALTIRSPQSTSGVDLGALAGVNAELTYVGAMTFTSTTMSVRLYPKLQLTVPSPPVGTQGVVQGQQYNFRLTFGASNSQYDIIDTSQAVLGRGINVPNPTPTDGSTPRAGDIYFGSFKGGDTTMTAWSIPVFLNIAASQLPKTTSYFGSMALTALTSGVSGYQLQITDSSIFIYSNINVDTSAIGSVSPKNIFLASAVINSSPDDLSSAAFAPCDLLLGIVQQVQMGALLKYVFIPEADSVVIGAIRYMVSVVELNDIDIDPSSRPYPPVQWQQTQFWQFANRHNPYRDVGYTGDTQALRTTQAQGDTARIGVKAVRNKEPMHMYLDTNRGQMTLWPIYKFPFASTTQAVDVGQLQNINNTILSILAKSLPLQTQFSPGSLDAEQITVPPSLQINNPFTFGAFASAGNANASSSFNQSTTGDVAPPAVVGTPLTKLNPGSITSGLLRMPSLRPNMLALQEQMQFVEALATESIVASTNMTNSQLNDFIRIRRPLFEPILGFSVYNSSTGEAYIVELVNADLDPPDQLPNLTKNVTYDPYYVRVVFLNSLKCYNMSIIVPSMVHDLHGNFARQGLDYNNVLSKTNELGVGYMYSLYDSSNNFATVNFTDASSSSSATSQTYIFTNNMYKMPQNALFNPGSLFGGIIPPRGRSGSSTSPLGTSLVNFRPILIDPGRIIFSRPPVPPVYFICRRQNWSKECHLMQATNPDKTSVYLSFGGGDIVPFKLDPATPTPVDRRPPSHMYALSHTISDRQYDAVKTVSVSNIPYMVGATTQGGNLQFMNFSLNTVASITGKVSVNQPLQFPTECYVVGQASTTLTAVAAISSQLKHFFPDTSQFVRYNLSAGAIAPDFKLIAYNNLVYMVRLVSDVQALAMIGGINVVSGLLIDTFVPSKTGHLNLAQAARHKRSGLSFFGSSYTPTTMADSLDTLDFTSITGETFYSPTIFIPIPEVDDSKGFYGDLSNFLGQQIWTFVYSEIAAAPGAHINGTTYPNGFNLDIEGKPILSLQKLHFVYDPLVVMYTPNDLAHKYPLQPKQQILALTNGQIEEGICWRSANLQPSRRPPSNVSAQQILPTGPEMDRPNIIYSSHNRTVTTSSNSAYKGMSVNSVLSVSGVTYNIEESAMAGDQVGSRLISTVSSTTNLLIAVLFDYDNDDIGTMTQATYNGIGSTKGVVFLNGYLSSNGYSFSSPDHFDVNDVLPSQVPFFEQIAEAMGDKWDISFYNTDITLPRQFWSMAYDTFTAPGLPNYISNVPPSAVDPNFTNRTRSLVLSLENSVRPDRLGLIDTYSSVVSANMHLQNGITGSVFLSKKAERDIVSIGSSSSKANPLRGLPPNYDFFIFSHDHYGTLFGATFDLIDQGYAMCLVDDGSGTANKVAKFYIDTDGNYFELYTYILSTPSSGIIESSSFILKVTLGSPADINAVPATPETPNNVNPQELVKHLNRTSQLVYATFGPTAPGQPAAYLPIQAAGGEIEAAPISGAPGFNGYSLNVVSANRQPVQISQIYAGAGTFSVAGATSIRPVDLSTGLLVPFYGSISHGLDKFTSLSYLPSKDQTSFLPRPTNPQAVSSGKFGGNGLGALCGTSFSCAFQGSPAIPPSGTTAGSVMRGDDTVFYTYNASSNAILDSAAARVVIPVGGQYFIDSIADPANPIYGVVTFPSFTLNGNLYTFNLSSTLADGSTSRYSLMIGGKSYLFNAGNSQVVVDRTMFTFNAMAHGIYTVSYSAMDAPAGKQAPSNTTLTPFSISAGGKTVAIDVFNTSNPFNGITLGVTGHLYTYNPIKATIAITVSPNTTPTVVPLQSGLTYTSPSGYGYIIGYVGGSYTVNGSPMYPYSSSTTGDPASYALMTSPKIFTKGNNFYTFDQDSYGGYLSVTGNGQTYPVNPYQFSINSVVYIINSNVQPNTVVGGGNVYTLSALNTQFLLNGIQYTIIPRQSSFYGATVSGQFNITKGNVVVIENYVYQLDTLNGQIVGNGTTYPLTTSGLTYTITTADRSFTVTTQPNASTVTIGNIVYQINNTTVVGDGVTYPVLPYRSFADGSTTYNVGLDGTVSVGPALSLSGFAPYTGSTFADGDTYTVNNVAASDGNSHYFLMTGTPPNQFAPSSGLSYTIRNDAVAINAGPTKTYIVNASDAPSGQFSFGSQTINFGPNPYLAAFDGQNYYAIDENKFTTTNPSATYTLSGNTAVHEGNSYEIFSNLGQEPYFQVPGGSTYFINISVAHTGSATGDVFNVFPISGGQFTVPLRYSFTVTGNQVTASSTTLSTTSAHSSVPLSTLTAAGGALTGGSFSDPVTKITYTCTIQGDQISFTDSNNTVYQYTQTNTTGTFIALVNVTTAISLAVDNKAAPTLYPVTNNQFTTDTVTYSINLLVAYQNARGPYWPIINGRFTVPKPDPVSDRIYTIRGGTVTKGFVLSNDDQFSADATTIYTIDAVNVVKTVKGTALSGTALNEVLTSGSSVYSLRSTDSVAVISPSGLLYDSVNAQFTVSYNGVNVTYSIGSQTVLDDRRLGLAFVPTIEGSKVTFLDDYSSVTFTFDNSGNNQVSLQFPYTNNFFTDVLTGVTYYVDDTDRVFQAVSYLPEAIQYGFVPANGRKYLIHYNNVQVAFPVISGDNVNAGVATVGSDRFSVMIDGVNLDDGSPGVLVNKNSFEVNGNLYTITGTPAGSNYSTCRVGGAGVSSRGFTSANTFVLTDPSVTYTLVLDTFNLPAAVTASFVVKPSRSLISVNDNVYVISYTSVSTGSLLGQGQASIPITDSAFTLTNRFDTTRAKFIFADLNIYDAASVVGQFTVYYSPTFFMGSTTYTLNTSTLVVTDNNKHPFPLISNPVMFSINGFNYVIDSNQTPHAIVGNNNISPLSTDVTVERGRIIPNSTFTLNGLIYKYTEDTLHNLLVVTGITSYAIAQPAMTFRLDSSLMFTLSRSPPAVGNFVGSVTPIGSVSAGTLRLNIFPGVPESGGADFFTYKGVMYTLIQSGGNYVAAQKAYTIYAAQPAGGQQQLAVFNLGGTTYLVTSGSTVGDATPTGINSGTVWAATSVSQIESQFGQVYGFASQPTPVAKSAKTGLFQFQATDANGTTTLYDIIYTAGGNKNAIRVDVPSLLPSFVQSWEFGFPVPSYPLRFETGGYDAYTTYVEGQAMPQESFSMAYKTPLVSEESQIDKLMSSVGDFTVEFWHSEPSTLPTFYHPFTYSASNISPLVYHIDIGFENLSKSQSNTGVEQHNVYVQVNNMVMKTPTVPPILSSKWRHLALTFAQPYAIKCQGAGFEVKDGTNYNFNREFSIAMTFLVSDTTRKQGLLYKGAGSKARSPDASLSYMVTVEGGKVMLYMMTGGPQLTVVPGPAILTGQLYELFISKQTVIPAGSAEDPYGFTPDAAAYKSGITGATTVVSGNTTKTLNNVELAVPTNVSSFSDRAAAQSGTKAFQVTIAVRAVNPDGTFQGWSPAVPIPPKSFTVPDDSGLLVNATGSAHLVIGSAFEANGTELPLGSAASPATIRQLYLFSTALSYLGIKTASGYVPMSQAPAQDLIGAGVVGHWSAQYDASGVVNNVLDKNAVAISTNPEAAFLAPLNGHEYEGISLYLNGYSMPVKLINPTSISASMPAYVPGSSLLNFNAGIYRLTEISMWRMCRQPSQLLSDMFGRLISTNEPLLILYLKGEFDAPSLNSDPNSTAPTSPLLPLNTWIDNVTVKNPITSMKLNFSNVSFGLGGCPTVGRCGPLVTPSLYTPPGVALTVCDTVPDLTTYSVTINNATDSLAGEIFEAYVYVQNKAIMIYAGKKVGDLVLSWVSQEQGDVQMIGYVEGAPPCPMANMTNRPNYTGATAVTFNKPTSVNMRYDALNDTTSSTKTTFDFGIGGGKVKVDLSVAPFGFGLDMSACTIALNFGITQTWSDDTDVTSQSASSNKVDEATRYTVKLQGTPTAVTGDMFMANLNTLATPSSTGTGSSRTAILPNPGLGGFTTSNPPGQLPRTAPTEEKYGARMFRPSPYGQAFVSSQTVDVYQQTLLQTNTVYGFIRIPNAQIPRDVNIVSFRMSSKYIRPGCLDGVVTYAYNPATLPSGAQTYTTSTGEMQVLYDKNFSPGTVGHDASYMRIIEAYKLKKQIDQQSLNALALYHSAYDTLGSTSDPGLTPDLDFYNEYIWSSRGGTQEVKHTYATSYNEIFSTAGSTSSAFDTHFNAKVIAVGVQVASASINSTNTSKSTTKYSYSTSGTTSFDVTASFDGIDTDTQMRYASSNDAHFIMKNNSTFNTNNQSGLNLVIGSDGLVYNIVPSVSSGGGLPVSDDIDDSDTYTQPQPAYSSGNASGLTGALEPYNRPGKTKLFRTYTYFLQPNDDNANEFWSTVVDPVWLDNSPDSDAVALRTARQSRSIPWRLLHRVTYSERFLPPVSSEAVVTPQITPIMAVPVTNGAADFLFKHNLADATTSSSNPHNDVEANVVLVAPTSSGLSAGTIPTTGLGTAVIPGQAILPNNVISFDLATNATVATSWGDGVNQRLLSRLTTSILGANTVKMTPTVTPGSTKIVDVVDPSSQRPLYTIYIDPNGSTINVPTDSAITVYQDVNFNPIQYYDGKGYHTLQADYIATTDGTIMYYIQPPSTYDQSAFDLLGDYDLFGHPGDEWRYYLVSGTSANMTSNATVTNIPPFFSSSSTNPFTGFSIPASHSDAAHGNAKLVNGYVLVQGTLQWPHLNTNAEVSADVLIYKSMSLLDTFPIGDLEVLVSFLTAQYPNAPFLGKGGSVGVLSSASAEIPVVFARNVICYFDGVQGGLVKG